jgi:thiol-disulfide isomerase/thioredoxin
MKNRYASYVVLANLLYSMASLSLMGQTIQEIKTIKEYRSALDTTKPVIIKIYTTWCPNCTTMEEPFKTSARQHANEALFLKVNADTDDKALQKIVMAYASRGVPTFVFRPKGNASGIEKSSMDEVQVGAPSGEQLKGKVDNFIQRQRGQKTTKPLMMKPVAREYNETAAPPMRKKRVAEQARPCNSCGCGR